MAEEIIKIQADNASPPYTNPNCQIALYQVLEAVFDMPCHAVSPPTNMAIQLFTKGQANAGNDYRLLLVCRRALISLEKICQPIGPSLVTSNESSYHDEGVREQNKFIYFQPERSASKRPASESDEAGPQMKNIRILDVQTIKPATEPAVTELPMESDASIVSTTAEDTADIIVESNSSEEPELIIEEDAEENVVSAEDNAPKTIMDTSKIVETSDEDEVDVIGGDDAISKAITQQEKTECDDVEMVTSKGAPETGNVVHENSKKAQVDVEAVGSTDEDSMLNSFVDVVDQ